MSEEDSSRPSPTSVPVAASVDAVSTHPEIEIYASEALSRFGAPGTLRVEGKYLVLYAPQGVLRVELDGLDEQWGTLGEESRRRRSSDLVRRLMSRRSLLPTPPPRRGGPSWAWPVVSFAAAIAAWAAYAARPGDTAGSEVVRRAASPDAQHATADPEAARRERAARVCESARARVLRGATLGPTDTEGWVVDVMLLRWGATEPLDRHPSVEHFLEPGESGRLRRFVWREEPELAALEGSDTGVVVTSELVEGPSGRRGAALRLTFGGALAERYFRPEERVRYFHVAHALSAAIEATHAGVFARCQGGETHHVGSWFRGTSPAEAAAALVYLVGLYAEPPHLADPFLRPVGAARDVDRAYALATLRQAADGLDQRRIAALLGPSGGMITSPPTGGAVITFPFTDGNRASRASREFARALRLGRP